MLSIQEVYDLYRKIGSCSFATLNGEGGVDIRIAQIFACDDDGLYLRTMSGKPFFGQMVDGGKLAVCGEATSKPTEWSDDNEPHFQPGYMLRISGDVRQLSQAEIDAHAESDPNFAIAVHDIAKYPETVVLVIYKAWGELFDYDFNMVTRDHKLERQRFAWGGATFVEPGFHITDDCIGCGSCQRACTYKAIEAGSPYKILGNRCDECGNCHHVCPVGAVVEKA